MDNVELKYYEEMYKLFDIDDKEYKKIKAIEIIIDMLNELGYYDIANLSNNFLDYN